MHIELNLIKFDRHFPMIHCLGFNELAEKFPSNSITLNGQGPDSIFPFGLSPRAIGALFQSILFCSLDIIYRTIQYKKLLKEVLSPKYKTIQSCREQEDIDGKKGGTLFPYVL